MSLDLSVLADAFEAITLRAPIRGAGLASMELVMSDRYPHAATDGKHLYINPIVLTWKPERILSLSIHEVMHKELKHHLRQEWRNDFDVWNQACDQEVWQLAKDEGYMVPSTACYWPEFIGMTAEEVYDILMKKKRQQPPPDNPSPKENPDDDESQDGDSDGEDSGDSDDSDDDSDGGDSGDSDDSGDDDADGDPGDDGDDSDDSGDSDDSSGPDGQPGNGSQESEDGEASDGGDSSSEGEAEDDGESIDGVVLQPRSGDGGHTESDIEPIGPFFVDRNLEKSGFAPSSPERTIGKVQRHDLDPRDSVSMFMSDMSGGLTEDDWMKPIPWYDDLCIPTQRQEKMPRKLLFAIDLSGSINNYIAQRQVNWVRLVADVWPNIEADVVTFDHELYGPWNINNIPENLPGGGGTDFSLAAEFAKDKYDGLVYLTDGDDTHHPQPGYPLPILWIIASRSGWYPQPPYGAVICIQKWL
jgi:predicted metal-dependent peptidase